MKILVTGHKGFIGSHVYDYFKNEMSDEFEVDALESEVHSDVDSYKNSDVFSSPPSDYDEQWDDDDGYPD